jgi:peptidoglycan/LPS O-acetylase OafA/YrhL
LIVKIPDQSWRDDYRRVRDDHRKEKYRDPADGHRLPVSSQNPHGSGSSSDIRALTGLRGVAAILVVVYHFWPRAEISSNWLKWTVGRGYLWVDLFFVLSGYVIALNYGRMFARGFSTAVFVSFLLRRLARIYPLYLALLGAQILYTIVVNRGFQDTGGWAAVTVTRPALDIPANLLLVQSLGIAPSIIEQAWSISTEFAAYLCFPIFVALIISGTWRLVATAGAAAIALLAVATMTVMHDGAYHSGSLDAYDGTNLAPMMRCMGGFLLGMLTFRIGSIPAMTAIAARDSVGLLTLIALLGALAVGAPDLAVVALFPPVVMCLAQNLGAAAAIFANPVTYCLGVWSYAVYLLHPLLQKPRDMMDGVLDGYVSHGLAETFASLAVIVILLILSWVSYSRIEVPGRRVIQRVAAGMMNR